MAALNDIHSLTIKEPLGLADRHTAIRRAPGWIDNRVLVANTAQVHTIPTDAVYVLFSADAAFWARVDETAAIPSGAVTDGSGSEQNPVGYEVRDRSTISLISAVACKMSLTFYKRV